MAFWVAVFSVAKLTKLNRLFIPLHALLSISYLLLLYPKPLHLLGLILYEYLIYLSFKKWYRSDNLVLPFLNMALPMLLMKVFLIFPEGTSETYPFMIWFQIAGISYLVFKAMSLYVDTRRDEKPIAVGTYFIFLSFVPTLLIGPLDRVKRFKSDLDSGFSALDATMYGKAWQYFIKGLAYKFILAEAIRRLVLAHLPEVLSFSDRLLEMYAYLFYLFFDFAGYSLLAMAFGYAIGIKVPFNFDSPFSSVNPKEFWKRWHKTLGDWLNDYFFRPLFKFFTQKKFWNSIERQNTALLLTFTLMGFWNGLELHYILSGMLFGFYSAVHNYYVYRCKKTKSDVFFGKMDTKWVKPLSQFFMIHLVAFSIYIFSGKLF